jgi:hypothetical protein
MAFVNHFYNSSTRKYVALFGTLFNKIRITRNGSNDAEVQSIIVPIAYGPFQKFLAKITQDPNLSNPSAITLPRMSFEMTNMSYDGTRKIASKQRIFKTSSESEDKRYYNWSGAPYNVDFSLYIMTKYSEDATKIVEQIIPFFKPEWTSTVKLIDDMDPIDIPLILNGVTNEELYEGAFTERRSVLWTLNFTMKCWYFGPEKDNKIIKFVDTDVYNTTNGETVDPVRGVNTFPGLTANGAPTTDADEAVPFLDVEYDDDWAPIKVVTEDPEAEV